MSASTATVIEKTERVLRRRTREELEALAAEFVGVGPRSQRVNIRQVIGATAIAVAAGALILWLMLPDFSPAHVAPRGPSYAAEDAQAAAKRLAERRARKRQELESTSAYLDRMAQADRALIKEMSERAAKLAEKASAPTRTSVAAAAAPKTAAPAVASASKPAPAAATPAPSASTPKVATAAPAQAPVQPATDDASAAQCSIHVSELSASGKLTYDDVARMKGARIDPATALVYTPPVEVAGGRRVTFEVSPDGCVRIVRTMR